MFLIIKIIFPIIYRVPFELDLLDGSLHARKWISVSCNLDHLYGVSKNRKNKGLMRKTEFLLSLYFQF